MLFNSINTVSDTVNVRYDAIFLLSADTIHVKNQQAVYRNVHLEGEKKRRTKQSYHFFSSVLNIS